MMRRAVFLLAAMLVGAAITATTASAQTFENDDDYAALCIPLTLSSSTVKPGDTINVSGTAATGGADIAIVLDNSLVLATTTSNSTSHFFSTPVPIPNPLSAGDHTLQAFQLGDDTDPVVGCPDSIATIHVSGVGIPPVNPATPGAEPLARTGSNSTMPLARLGFGLLAAGGAALLVSRRRRATASAAA